MSKKSFDLNDEFAGTSSSTEMLPVEDAAEGNEVEKVTYTLKDGSQGSRAAYIREMFLVDNLSRKTIADTTGFPYRIVYSATVNLSNEAEPAGRGRSITNAVIKVYGDKQTLVKVTEDGTYLDVTDGTVVPANQLTDVGRNEWIKAQVEAGVSRSDISKWLDLSYGVIYNLTKDQDGVRAKYDVTLEDGTTISRSEYIRELFASGTSRSDIAKQLEVPYSIVWQATKTEKDEATQFAEAVQQIESFRGKVVDDTALELAIDDLKAVQIKAE